MDIDLSNCWRHGILCCRGLVNNRDSISSGCGVYFMLQEWKEQRDDHRET